MIADRDDHGGDHDPQIVDHADGGDDRVEREDDVEQHDLDDDARKRRRDAGRRVPLLALQPVVNLEVLLASRNRPPTIRIRSRPEISCPRIVNSGAVSLTIQASENSSSDARDHRAEQAEPARPRLLRRGSLPDEDRDENDVVDAEDDFQKRERREGDPDFAGVSLSDSHHPVNVSG